MSVVLKSGLMLGGALAMMACADKSASGIDYEPSPYDFSKPTANTGAVVGTAITEGGNVAPNGLQFTAEDEIAFTNPDDPDAGIPELETLMAASKRGPWEDSETLARQTAAREGKPILIWFTDSSRSPICKLLSNQLLSRHEFGEWAEKNVVRLRVDSTITVDDPDLTLDAKVTRQVEIRRYVDQIKKRYKVRGHPTLLMLHPSGEVLWKESGYRAGEADYLWGLMKHAVAVTAEQYKEWRKKLEAKGYRDWEGVTGRKVFAKLVSYSQGNLVLVEPGGVRYKTHESKLSNKDHQWIREQKAKRGIE
jgi:thioredoxin-related protein